MTEIAVASTAGAEYLGSSKDVAIVVGGSAGTMSADATEAPVIELPIAVRLMDIARTYTDRLKADWPNVLVYRESRPRTPGRLSLIALADTVDFEMEDRIYELMVAFMPYAEQAGFFLDVAAYFRSRCVPDLAGYELVA